MAARGAELRELAGVDPSITLLGDGATRIWEITFDSRTVEPGHLFVALRGADFDGHDFVDQAIRRGAAAVMVEEDVRVPVPRLVCRDTRSALASVASTFFGYPSQELTVVGITGTDGKTTTAHIVDAVLRSQGIETGLIGTVAVRINDAVDLHASRQTTPESLDIQRYLRLMVDAGVRVAILEATSHGLDLHRLDHVAFDLGAVTNITREHLEHHKTVEAYRRAKGTLFERVGSAAGSAIINLDDDGAREMLRYTSGANILTYGIENDQATLRAEEVTSQTDGSTFILRHESECARVQFPLIGSFNIANALCATGVCLALGMSLREIAAGLALVPPVPGRMATVSSGQPFSVIVDYAHTPESLAKVLRLLRQLQGEGRIIAVFGSAGERDTEKRPRQGAIASRLADIVVITTEDPRHEHPDTIIEEIAAGSRAAGGRDGETLFTVTNRDEAIALAISMARPGDQVLLAGKGHESSIIVGTDKTPWDEAGSARAALARLGWQGD